MKKASIKKPTEVITEGSILQHVDELCRLACGSKLSEDFFSKAKPSIDIISDLLNITPIQAVIFCSVLAINFRSESVNLDDASRFLECSPIAIFTLKKEFDVLVERQIFKISFEDKRKRFRHKSKLSMIEYYVNNEVIEKTLWEGEKFTPTCTQVIDDVFQLFQAITERLKALLDDFCTTQEAFEEIQLLLNHNSHLQFVVEIKKEMLDQDSLMLFLACCAEFLDVLDEINLARIITSLYKGELRHQMKIRQSILSNTNPLIAKGLITFESGTFRSDSYATLTDKSLAILIPEIEFTKNKARHDKNQVSIAASSIVEKRLYFDAELQKQLDFLTEALQPTNYDNLVGRLIEVGLRTGVCCLLHGLSGTGKTEFVNQLARQTGRDLHPVSIAETKNKFFGESEKQILKVFKNYRTSLERSQVVPILFLNEADGILSTRKKIGSSAVDQTENSIQNIILQEMEDLNGIMICTTNLVTNLDPAFERRFLYKIKFEKPSVQAKQSIWQDKIATLSESEAMNLAQEFDFSGGAIENIARKCLMAGVLNGRLPDLSEILGMCREESLYKRKETRRIGYLQ